MVIAQYPTLPSPNGIKDKNTTLELTKAPARTTLPYTINFLRSKDPELS